MLEFLRKTYSSYIQDRKIKKDKEEKIRIAKHFNNRYTYITEYIPDKPQLPGNSVLGPFFNPRGGYAWMCPECNNIHHPIECSLFSGLQYPRCCNTPQGHRLYDDIEKTR